MLKLIVDVFFSAANLFQSPTNFIMEFVQKSLEIPWNFSRYKNSQTYFSKIVHKGLNLCQFIPQLLNYLWKGSLKF